MCTAACQSSLAQEDYTAAAGVAVSGQVSANGTPVQWVILNGLPTTPITDAQGTYSTWVPPGWSGTVTPVAVGYTFSPTSRAYTNVTAAQTSQDYAGTPLNYTITGSVKNLGVGVPNVTLTGLPGNPVTNAIGTYTASVIYGWSGTVTPTKAGYVFTPGGRSYTNVAASKGGEDYGVVTIQMLTIAGQVMAGTAPIAGVTMSGLPGNPVTDASGNYTVTVDYGWSGTVTPSKANCSFNPPTRTYSNQMQSLAAENYSASLLSFTISGQVKTGTTPVAGVTMNGLPGNPVTDASGNYSATVSRGWGGTVTPAKAGLDFSPPSRTYSNQTQPLTGEDYSATVQTVAISGRITTTGGGGLAGVTLTGLPGNPVTAGDGSYSAAAPYNWSGTATPSKSGYVFTPSSHTYGNVVAATPNQNYATVSRTFYVDDDAPSDPGPGNPAASDPLADGSAAHPFDAIQKAINAARSADVIVVLPGTYTGTGNRGIDYGGRAVTVRSSNPLDPSVVAATVIDCQQTNLGFYFHNGETSTAVLSGVTIVNGYVSGYGGGIWCSSSPSITYCVIQNCTAADTGMGSGGGGIVCVNAQPQIANCTILGNRTTGVGCGGGIYWQGGAAPRITNSVIAGNSAGTYGGGLCFQGSSPTIENCTIVDNSMAGATGGAGIHVVGATATFTARNCIFRDNDGQAGIFAGATPTITYSVVQGGFNGTGNLSSYPMLTRDYHLQAGSPCINAGDPAYVVALGETDIDGQARVAGGRIDIGADEYVLPGDANGDGHVDVIDLLALIGAFGTYSGDAKFDPACDFNNDGTVDTIDLLTLVANFGQ